jgi:hypothetical protein
LAIIACSGSIAMTNRSGKRGSPCLNPQPCRIEDPDTSFRRTLEEAR